MLHYNTINENLKTALDILMKSPVFNQFRLVGGTALSLQKGHRISIDIDLFSDAPYGDIDFEAIDRFIEVSFPYCHHTADLSPTIGKSYIVGNRKDETIKLDIYYTDTFIHAPFVEDNLRMATIEEIIAMKLDVLQRGGRKKDYWDLHMLIKDYSIESMLGLHEMRYPYSHDQKLILKNLTDFRMADDDFDPICLLGNTWEFIKEDIIDAVERFQLPN
jgi:predicted nucleotidyltransferase component of viral defense system